MRYLSEDTPSLRDVAKVRASLVEHERQITVNRKHSAQKPLRSLVLPGISKEV